jgi:hypothetical protein
MVVVLLFAVLGAVVGVSYRLRRLIQGPGPGDARDVDWLRSGRRDR